MGVRIVPFLIIALAAGCGRPSPPNIILILADDLGRETLSSYGGTSYHTPNLDALADGGMRFTYAYSTPLCTPSRVQLLTGKYNFRNYVGFGLLDPGEPTIAQYLRESGYHTAIVGKWQLYGNERQRELAGRVGSLPEEAGFDEYLLWQIQERGLRYKNPLLYPNALTPVTYPDAYGPDVFVSFIESFLARDHEAPFFLYYPMVLTHAPFQPTPGDPAYEAFDPETGISDPQWFSGYMQHMDGLIGRIVASLEQNGLREKTLILFVGDNGTDRNVVSRFNGMEYRGNKGYPDDAGTHVPLIASWPGTIRKGGVNESLVDFTDFFPTLLEAAGVTTQERRPSDGLSFYRQLTGTADTTRAWIFCHYAPRWGTFANARYVQDRSWKLYDDGRFFDLRTDPFEKAPIPDSLLSSDTESLKQDFERVLERMR